MTDAAQTEEGEMDMESDMPVITAYSEKGRQFAALFVDICREQQGRKIEWVKQLREQGVKAAHPNDGWIDRDHCIAQFCYPHFNDGVQVGDVIALGWPGEKWFLAKVTMIETGWGATRYHYEAKP